VGFLFVKVGGDAVHNYHDLLGDCDPSSPLVEAYLNHFFVDSLVSYFASGYLGCYLEDFLKRIKGLISKPLSLCLNLVSNGLDTA
jgi:hypothetical protein